jgi:hypothetical protein
MDSNIIEIWSLRIAEVAAPNEIDSAPLMTKAFIEGGKNQRSLLSHKKENMLGGFGGIEGTYIFSTILITIYQLNKNGTLSNILETYKSLGSILEPITPIKHMIDLYDREKNKQNRSFPTAEENEYLIKELDVNLIRILNMFVDEMSKSGIPKEQCEIIAYNTLLRLFEDPSSSIHFVKAVSKKP